MKFKIRTMLKVLLLILICFFTLNNGIKVRAEGDDSGYSEEEKEAAKAWLSAHGYPPTRAGAEMAYQDYLNGKFDDDPEVRKYREENEGASDNTETETTEVTTEATTEMIAETTTEMATKSNTENSTTEVASAKTDNPVTEEKIEKVTIENELKSDDLKISDPSEVQLIMTEEEVLDQPKGVELSDILLVAGGLCAVSLTILAIKAGKKKKSEEEE